MALSIHLHRHLAHTSVTLSPAAHLEQAQALQRLLGFLGDVDLEGITAHDLKRFAHWLSGVYPRSGPATLDAAKQALDGLLPNGELSALAIRPQAQEALRLGWEIQPDTSATADWK